MKNAYRIVPPIAVLLLVSVQTIAQLPKDPEERAKVIARIVQTNARQLTLFDREGKELGTAGQRDLYNQPVFSPDGKRIAVIKIDLEKESNDLWIIDVDSGKSTKVTLSGQRESATAPAWSPDGARVAYVGLRQGGYGLYQKLATGDGEEELLYKSNTPLTLTDWSMDGRYLAFFASDLGGGAIFALPLMGTGERKPIEIFRSNKQVTGPRFSPDARFVSYISDETGRNELYVRPFNPSAVRGTPPSDDPWKISDQGAQGMAFWRRDGKELTFLAADRSIMAVSATTSPLFEFGKPNRLFSLLETTPILPGTASVNRDVSRFVIAVPPPQLRQLTILDRQGKTQGTVGLPGVFGQLALSPEGKRLAAVKNDPQTGINNIWVYEIATGQATPITNDTRSNVANNSPVWSRDGQYVAYVTVKDGYSHIYRKAADGSGASELLFRYTPGAFVLLSDWSPDGRFLTFSTGVLLVIDLRGNEKSLDRKALEWLREDYDASAARFSPDGRSLAYFSNEVDVFKQQVYVRSFDPNKPDAPAGPAVQISDIQGGAGGSIFWRKDGKEVYFMNLDREILALPIIMTPKIEAGVPAVLFKLDPLVNGGPVSADGERFIVAVPIK